jgi:hypothetical protein
MADIRRGHVEGPGKGREIPVMASQYFHIRGGHFVKLREGNATLCASGDAIVAGWAVTPKQDTGKSAWKSGGKEVDKVFVIYGLEDVFSIPVNEKSASLAASWIGQGAGLLNTGATYAITQKALIGGAVTASPLSIVGVDTSVNPKVAYVKIKPAKRQAN